MYHLSARIAKNLDPAGTLARRNYAQVALGTYYLQET